jgi:lipoate-protein ligase A
MEIRLLNTGFQDAALNMALDEAILTRYNEEKTPPTLRVFRWKQIAISLGRFQDVEREILTDVCEQLGVALVRRPTGGRAVYHCDEFTYSMVIGRREGVPPGVIAAYAHLAQGLLAALNLLGIDAELVTREKRVGDTPDAEMGGPVKPNSAACFASTTQADLSSGGLKLVGSAQVWKDRGLLQQGSIPIDDCAPEFFSMLRYPSEEARQEALAAYYARTQPLHTYAPGITWDEIAIALARGFGLGLQAQVVPGEVEPEEWALAQQLIDEKYSKLAWRKERIRLVE